MKKYLFLFLILLICAFQLKSQPIAKVDESIELVSTVFRLIGAKEYVNNSLKRYTEELDSTFLPFKNHPIFTYAKEIRAKDGISYDAIADYAVRIAPNSKGEIALKDGITFNGLDGRWKKGVAIKFTKLLNDFYKKSKFHNFFTAHQEFYDMACVSLNQSLNVVDFNWFQEFFGSNHIKDSYTIASLLNVGNYGIHILKGNAYNAYIIIGNYIVDKKGMPLYNNITDIIVHEFCHSYCNPLVDKNITQFYPKANSYYQLVEDKLHSQAYGAPSTVIYETLVRASSFQYESLHNKKDIYILMDINRNKCNGFLWIANLYESMDYYNLHRDKYPTLESYMPNIIKLHNNLDVDSLYIETLTKTTKMYVQGIENGDTCVSPNIKSISLIFDRPIIRGQGIGNGNKPEAKFPDISNTKWSQDKTQWCIEVNLLPDTYYSISFPASFFYNADYYPCQKNIYLNFKTSKE